AGAAVVGNVAALVSPTNVTLTLTNDATLTWNWNTNFYLALTASGPGALDQASGWGPARSNAVVFPNAPNHSPLRGWAGSTSGTSTSSNKITAPMTAARTLVATFAADQYKLTVGSVQGGALPAAGTASYDYGTLLTASVTNSPLNKGVLSTQFVCVGWVG